MALIPTNTTTQKLIQNPKMVHFVNQLAVRVVIDVDLQVPMAAPARLNKPPLANEPKLIAASTTKPFLHHQWQNHLLLMMEWPHKPENVLLHDHYLLPTPELIKQSVLLQRR